MSTVMNVIRRGGAAAAAVAATAYATNQQSQQITCQAGTTTTNPSYTHTQQIQQVAKQIFGPVHQNNTIDTTQNTTITTNDSVGLTVHSDPQINELLISYGTQLASNPDIIKAVEKDFFERFGSWIQIGPGGALIPTIQSDDEENKSQDSNTTNSSSSNSGLLSPAESIQAPSETLSISELVNELENESFQYYNIQSGLLLSAEQLRQSLHTEENEQFSPFPASPINTSLSSSFILQHSTPNHSFFTNMNDSLKEHDTLTHSINNQMNTDIDSGIGLAAPAAVAGSAAVTPIEEIPAPSSSSAPATATASSAPPQTKLSFMDRLYNKVVEPVVSWIRGRLTVPTATSSTSSSTTVPPVATEGIPHAQPVQETVHTASTTEVPPNANTENKTVNPTKVILACMPLVLGIAGVLIVLVATRRISPTLFQKIVLALKR